MPQVIDDTCAYKGTADSIEGDPPWIAGSFTEQFKSFRSWVDPKHRASKLETLPVLFYDRRVKNTVESIEISVWAPGQRIG